jgi:hypothetical protein
VVTRKRIMTKITRRRMTGHLPVTRSMMRTRIMTKTMTKTKRITTGHIHGMKKMSMDAGIIETGKIMMIAGIRTEAVPGVSPAATGDIPALPEEGVLQVWTRNAAGRSPAGAVNIPMTEGLLPAADVPALPAGGAVVVPAAAAPVLRATAAVPVSSPAAAAAAVMAAVPAAGKPNDPFHTYKQIGPAKTLFVCLINIY